MIPGYLQIASIAVLYMGGFTALSIVRRQGLPRRFLAESAAVSCAAVAFSFVLRVSPLAFLIALYLVTMRVRLLTDLGNWFTNRGRTGQALAIFRFALSLGPDAVSGKIAVINRAVAKLRGGEGEQAYLDLRDMLLERTAASPGHDGGMFAEGSPEAGGAAPGKEIPGTVNGQDSGGGVPSLRVRPDVMNLGPRCAAAGLYNLGVAGLRTGRRGEARRCFELASQAFPGSLYDQAARKALERCGTEGEHAKEGT